MEPVTTLSTLLKMSLLLTLLSLPRYQRAHLTRQEVAGTGFIDTAQDTITTFTAGVDTIEITATAVNNFVHGTNTDLGLGTATSEATGEATGYATNVGLINLNAQDATDDFDDAGDILIAFASPTTTMTRPLLKPL